MDLYEKEIILVHLGFYRLRMDESELDLERVKGEPFDDPEDPLGVLDELLHSHVPLRF